VTDSHTIAYYLLYMGLIKYDCYHKKAWVMR